MALPAMADEPEEVLIGTFNVRAAPAASVAATTPSADPAPSAAAPPVSAPSAATPTPAAAETVHRTTPADQLGAALGLFAAGDRGGGQRALEVLVADWPRSAEAGHARRTLAELYRQEPVAATPAAATAHATAPAISEGWTAVVRRDAGLDRRFILEAGDRVFFGLGSADLGARARTVLTTQARWLEARPTIFAVIEGHADEPGSEAENLAVSQKRAEAVRDRLIEEGVGPDRVRAMGLGRSQRLAECDEPECAAQNRRVVTAIYSPEGSGAAPPASPLSALPPPTDKGQPRSDVRAAELADIAADARARR